jgi:hypothetical protein
MTTTRNKVRKILDELERDLNKIPEHHWMRRDEAKSEATVRILHATETCEGAINGVS